MRASTAPRSTASCRSRARCRRSSWPSISDCGPIGWTQPATAAASGSAWSSTRRPPLRRDWSRSSSSPTGRHSGPTSRRSCAWPISRSELVGRSSSRHRSATRWGRTTPWWPGGICTSSAPPLSSWPRWPCRPATTPGSTLTPSTGTRSRSTTSSTRRWCGTRCPSCTAASAPTVAVPSCSRTRSGRGTAPRRRCGCSARVRRPPTRR